MFHPSLDMLLRFGRGNGAPRENRQVLAHLLRGCTRCATVVKEASGVGGTELPPDAYDEVFERVAQWLRDLDLGPDGKPRTPRRKVSGPYWRTRRGERTGRYKRGEWTP